MAQYSYTSEKLKHQQQESSSSSSSNDALDILTTIGSILVTGLIFTIRNLIFIYNYGHANYPELTSLLTVLLAAYVVYKIASRIIRFWINLFVTTVKVIFVIFIIILAFAIYIRGFQRLINHDLPLLTEFLFNNVHDLFSGANNQSFSGNSSSTSSSIFNALLSKVTGSKLFSKFVASKAKSFLDDIDNINVDEYVEYMQTNLKGSKSKSSDGSVNYENLINQGLDYLKKNDLNVDDIKDFFKNNI